MPSISKVHTPCKNCVFAKYKNITQVGCLLHYLDKYKSKGSEILEVYDEEKEFYVINDKKCLGYRENKWFSTYGLEHASIEEKINKFKDSNYMPYLMVVDLKEFDDVSFKEFQNQIENCNIKPQKIIFIRYQWINNFHFNKIKNLLESTKINCKWRVQTMVDDGLDNKDILHNIININKGYRFIISISQPNTDIVKIIEKANKIVYDDLEPLTVLKNTTGTSILFSAPSYRWSMMVEKKSILDNEDNYIII